MCDRVYWPCSGDRNSTYGMGKFRPSLISWLWCIFRQWIKTGLIPNYKRQYPIFEWLRKCTAFAEIVQIKFNLCLKISLNTGMMLDFFLVPETKNNLELTLLSDQKPIYFHFFLISFPSKRFSWVSVLCISYTAAL